MKIYFDKMHGTLNDFVVFEDIEDRVKLSAEQISMICRRRAGVGADGLIAVRKSQTADFFMDYINADGSIAEMCGNGIRCLGKYVYDNGLTNKTSVAVETRAGLKTLELIVGKDGKVEHVRVDMGLPIFDTASIPVNLETDGAPVLDYVLEAGGREFRCAILSMGNPHCVIVMDGVPDAFPSQYGPLIETHPLFPAKTNVEFIHVQERERIVMKVWERGSGITLACGTGACASMVACALKGLIGTRATVELPGGDLEIEWKGNESPVIMTGPTQTTYTGTVTI